MKNRPYLPYFALFLLFLCLRPPQLQAQDPILSQYFANRMYLNPALTNYEGGMNVSSNYRNQWLRLGLNSGQRALFETHSFGLELETPCRDVALGLLYLDNTEGVGDLRWQHIGFSAAYRTPFLGQRIMKVRNQWLFGLKISYNQYTLNPDDDFVFSDQLDAYRGIVSPSSAFWTQHPTLPATGYTDVDFGAAWVANPNHQDRMRLGFSVQHLSRPDKSVLGADDRLGFRPVIHGSYMFKDPFDKVRFNEFVPMFKLEWQNLSIPETWTPRAPFRWFRLPTDFKYTYWSLQSGVMTTMGSLNQLWLGAFFQGRVFSANNGFKAPNIYSVITTVGMETRPNAFLQARFGVSWDFNLSAINSDGLGTVEGFVQLRFPKFSFNPDCRCGPIRGKKMIEHDPF